VNLCPCFQPAQSTYTALRGGGACLATHANHGDPTPHPTPPLFKTTTLHSAHALCPSFAWAQVAELTAVQRAAVLAASELGGGREQAGDADSTTALTAELQVGLTDLLVSEMVCGCGACVLASEGSVALRGVLGVCRSYSAGGQGPCDWHVRVW
jgi:hypothetical protein